MYINCWQYRFIEHILEYITYFKTISILVSFPSNVLDVSKFKSMLLFIGVLICI